ncbi:hypothetical protein OAX78_04360, partial [Planctomycetota bacterium]|nr:hypothetical protein [Planctomycetota bacterium]
MRGRARPEDPLNEVPPQPPKPWRRVLLTAGLRGGCVALALGLVLGPFGWPLLGFVVAAAACVEHWGATGPPNRAAKALVLIWLIGLAGVPTAFLNGIYMLGLVQTGSLGGALALVEQSWRALSEPTVDTAGVWRHLFPWCDLWLWTSSPRCLLETTRLIATVLAAVSVGPLCTSHPVARGLVSFTVAVPASLVACVALMPPDLPHSLRATSMQGMEEGFALLATILGMAVFLPMLVATLGFLDRSAAATAPKSHRPTPAVFAALTAFVLVAVHVGLVLGPAHIEPRHEQPWINALHSDDR